MTTAQIRANRRQWDELPRLQRRPIDLRRDGGRVTAAAEDFMTSLGDTSLVPAIEVLEGPHPEEHRAPLTMGHDGDDSVQLTSVKFRLDGNGDQARLLASLAPADMLQSGHGFLIRDIGTTRKTFWRTTCELCGTALAPPAAEGWLCELGCQPGSTEWDQCGCNWCLIRGQWLRGEYRPRGGRPAKRCNASDCKRKAAQERKRRQRIREKTAGALARIDEVPVEHREGFGRS